MDGAGWAPEIGAELTLEVTEGEMRLLQFARQPIIVPLSTVQELHVEDHEERRGGGAIGGGLGLPGAAIGIAAASVINGLLSSSKRFVTVRVDARGGYVVVVVLGMSTEDVRRAVRPLADAVVASRSSTPSVSEELSRLADLRDRGVLSESEFTEQKARLLH